MSTVREITRLTKEEIKLLFAHAWRMYKSPEMDILIAPAWQQPYGKILVVTSAAVGNAPQRNKLRRQIKAIFYEEKLFCSGYHCVVITKPKAKFLAFEEIKKALFKAFQNFKEKTTPK